jgi:branched-chain amino acid transport system substrate-binding protein
MTRPASLWLRLSAVLAILSLVAVACGSTKKSGNATATTVAKAAQVVRLGGMFNLTGNFAPLDQPSATMLEMAVKKANDQGIQINGQPIKFDLHIEDSGSDAAKAAPAAASVIDSFGAQIVFGGSSTGTVQPLITASQRNGNILLISSATGMDTVVGQEAPFFRGYAPTATLLSRDVAPVLARELPEKNFALVLPSDAVGDGVVAAWTGALKTTDIKIVATERFAPNTTDFVSVLRRLPPSVDTIVVGYTDAIVRNVINAATEAGVKKKFLVYGAQFEAVDGSQDKVESYTWLILNSQDPRYPSNDSVKGLVDEYMKTTGRPLSSNIGIGFFYYDAIGMLVDAMKAAKSATDAKAIAAQIRGRTYNGRALKITFDAKGVNQSVASVAILRDGKVQVRRASGS